MLKPWQVQLLFDRDGAGGGGPPGDVAGAPPGRGGGGGGNDFPDLPADRSQDAGGEAQPGGLRFIDEAFDQLSSDEQNQDVVDQPRQPQRPPARREPAQHAEQDPQYPQPVQVRGKPQAQQQQQRVAQQGQDQDQEQEEPPAPQPLTPEQQAEQQAQLRARSDPFGMQAEMLQEQEQRYVAALAEQVYPISQQDMDAFLSGDGTKVSQALARVHVNAVGSVMKVVSQQLPVMMGHYMRMHSAARDREEQFYRANTFLDREKHGPMVANVARTYRQMYPNATAAQVDKAVGIMVAAAVGVQVPAGYTWGGKQQQANTRHQTSNGVRTPGKVVRQTTDAFSPAGANGVGGAPRQPDLGVWGELTEIIQADERGAFDR